MKTGSEIESDFFLAVQNTELAKAVSGEIYRDDFRPRDSDTEDIVVRLTSVTSGQMQEGVLTLLVFVPDIDVHGLGSKKRNSARLEELEVLSVKAVDEMRQSWELRCYDDVELQMGVQSYPDNNEQHFVSVKIGFRILN